TSCPRLFAAQDVRCCGRPSTPKRRMRLVLGVLGCAVLQPLWTIPRQAVRRWALEEGGGRR
ncbi:unnamed protein product, partial [Ectocarpus sp. 13 AM-2016]